MPIIPFPNKKINGIFSVTINFLEKNSMEITNLSQILIVFIQFGFELIISIFLQRIIFTIF